MRKVGIAVAILISSCHGRGIHAGIERLPNTAGRSSISQQRGITQHSRSAPSMALAMLISSRVANAFQAPMRKLATSHSASKEKRRGIATLGVPHSESTLNDMAFASAALALALATPSAALASDAVQAASGGLQLPAFLTKEVIASALSTAPFFWAGNEFWRRIANGDSFGTSKDRIVINPDVYKGMIKTGAEPDQLRRAGGKRILGEDAMMMARFLFGIAYFTLAVCLYTAYDAVSKGYLPPALGEAFATL